MMERIEKMRVSDVGGQLGNWELGSQLTLNRVGVEKLAFP
jgi:hypothetical protein